MLKGNNPTILENIRENPNDQTPVTVGRKISILIGRNLQRTRLREGSIAEASDWPQRQLTLKRKKFVLVFI